MAQSLAIILFTTTMAAQTIDRTKPPQTPELPVYKLPALFETTLPNGMPVVLMEDRRFPLVTARLGFEAGSKFDPPDLRGLSEAVAGLLTEGTAKRTARQIAEEVAAIGGSLNANSTPDSLIVSGSALAENLPRLLDLVADVARNASFPEDEVALRKQNRKQELLAQLADPGFLADEKLEEVIFGRHPYSRTNPTLESIDRFDRRNIAAFRDRHVLPGNAVLVLLGALPPREQVLDLIARLFGDWKGGPAPAAPAPEFPTPGRSIVLIDRPGSVQTDVRIGQLAVDRRNPGYFPLVIANHILGGGTSSRMFMTIREKHGFAYDIHTAPEPRKTAGLFAAFTQVRNEAFEPALNAVLTEMARMGNEDVTAAELANAKNYLSGVFVIRLETQRGLADQLAGVKLMGLPRDYLETYTSRVRSVEPDQIRAVSRKYVSPEDAAIVLVGDAGTVAKQAEKFGKVKIEKAPQ